MEPCSLACLLSTRVCHSKHATRALPRMPRANIIPAASSSASRHVYEFENFAFRQFYKTAVIHFLCIQSIHCGGICSIFQTRIRCKGNCHKCAAIVCLYVYAAETIKTVYEPGAASVYNFARVCGKNTVMPRFHFAARMRDRRFKVQPALKSFLSSLKFCQVERRLCSYAHRVNFMLQLERDSSDSQCSFLSLTLAGIIVLFINAFLLFMPFLSFSA